MGCFLSLIHNQINELTVGKQGNHSKILSYKISKYIFTYELLRSLRLCFFTKFESIYNKTHYCPLSLYLVIIVIHSFRI